MIQYTKYKKCYSSNIIFTEEVPYKIFILEITPIMFTTTVHNTISNESEFIERSTTLAKAKECGKKYLEKIGIVDEARFRKSFLVE